MCVAYSILWTLRKILHLRAVGFKGVEPAYNQSLTCVRRH